MNVAETEVVLDTPLRFLPSFRLHRFGSGDPAFDLSERHLRQALVTPEGPAVLDIEAEDPPQRFRVRAYGAGRNHVLARAARILGSEDDPSRFIAHCAAGRRLLRAAPGLRLTRAADPTGMLIALVFQQRVAWRDAARAYGRLVRRYGSRAPGPFDLQLPPTPKAWATIPPAEFSALDMDRRRADTVREVAKLSRRVDALYDAPPAEVARKLTSVPGLGPWTVQNFLGFAQGYADALPTGDYDLPHRVAMAFTGAPRSNDAEMIRLLEPYRGHRWRIIRMIEASGMKLVRFAPRRGSGRRRGR